MVANLIQKPQRAWLFDSKSNFYSEEYKHKDCAGIYSDSFILFDGFYEFFHNLLFFIYWTFAYQEVKGIKEEVKTYVLLL